MAINDLYLILKSRREYLRQLKKNISTMDFMSERNRTKFIETIESEIELVQRKIDDLIW